MSNHHKFDFGGGRSCVRSAVLAIKRLFNSCRARCLLAELHKHELRNVGLRRDHSQAWGERLRKRLAGESDAEKCRRALRRLRADQLSDLSEAGLRARRAAKPF